MTITSEGRKRLESHEEKLGLRCSANFGGICAVSGAVLQKPLPTIFQFFWVNSRNAQ